MWLTSAACTHILLVGLVWIVFTARTISSCMLIVSQWPAHVNSVYMNTFIVRV